jgi:hypothetical protein
MVKRLNQFVNKRALLILFAVTMVWFSLGLSLPVNETKAAPAAQCPSLPVITYYTDASKTVVCGVWDICSGTYPECWTEYTTKVRKVCCNPV